MGCKVNQDETAGMEILFKNGGHDIVSFDCVADVYIVNTCTVTQMGSRKSRQLLRQARRRNGAALVVALGCYPQTAADELSAMPELDLVVGNSHKPKIVEIVEEALSGLPHRRLVAEPGDFEELPVGVSSGRHRATLKIQEGCERFCSYCIVPMARGQLRSMPVEQVVSRALELAAQGYREIVLTGINLTSYGRERDDGRNLAAVVSALEVLPPEVRVRLSSVEPTDLDLSLINAIQNNSAVCRHFHIPLQSGSSEILKRMGRQYSQSQYFSLVHNLRKQFANPSFSTDIIVGFPGETHAHFQETVELVRELQFCKIHVFRYSPRPGTPAAGFHTQISSALKSARSQELIAAGQIAAREYAQTLVNTYEQVLLEGGSIIPGHLVGYGQRYVRIHCRADLPLGTIADVMITGAHEDELAAVVV